MNDGFVLELIPQNGRIVLCTGRQSHEFNDISAFSTVETLGSRSVVFSNQNGREITGVTENGSVIPGEALSSNNKAVLR